jgi:hypothetical protein
MSEVRLLIRRNNRRCGAVDARNPMISARDFCDRLNGFLCPRGNNETQRAKLVSGIRKLARLAKRGMVYVQNVTITEEIKPDSFVLKRVTFEIVERNVPCKPSSKE